MSIAISRDGENLIISTPYDEEIIRKIKSLPRKDRHWDPKKRAWVVHVVRYRELFSSLQGHQIKLHPPNLIQEIELRIKCIICNSKIDCNNCFYKESCPMKSETKYCLCSNCLEGEDFYIKYFSVAANMIYSIDRSSDRG